MGSKTTKAKLWLGLGAYVMTGAVAAGTATADAAQGIGQQPPAAWPAGPQRLAGEPGSDPQGDARSDVASVAARVAQRILLASAEGGEGDEGGEGGEAGESSDGGEGGEGGEAGGMPTSYKLLSTDPNAFRYDAAAQLRSYADLVFATYSAAHSDALALQRAIKAFLDQPTEDTLAAARFAWLNARPAYLQSEAFRFYDGPIDVDPATGEDGPEGRINAWPLNEAHIDYVEGQPDAGLINDTSQPISKELILANDQVDDEADVTTGWHAIEFLLWGQDHDAYGPGHRPASDYIAGQDHDDRRRLYLETVTGMLVSDLAWLADQWAPNREDNYRDRFLELDQREALGRVMNGMAQLAGYEMASERLAVALDSGDQEDEHSCFSDNTRNDHIYDLRGIRNVYFGQFGAVDGAGIDRLLAAVDPTLNQQVIAALNRAEAAAAAIDQPFDRVLAAPPGSAPRLEAEAAVTALQDLSARLKEAGNKLGLLVIVAGL